MSKAFRLSSFRKSIALAVSIVLFLLSGFFLLKNLDLLPAEAINPDFHLSIAGANLANSPVLNVEKQGTIIPVPDHEIGRFMPINSNATLLVGHSSGVFKDLKNLTINDEIHLDAETYQIKYIETLPIETIDMNKVLYPDLPALPKNAKVLVLMTCAGDRNVFTNTYSQRLIIYAKIMQ
jgi:hypothetical protein